MELMLTTRNAELFNIQSNRILKLYWPHIKEEQVQYEFDVGRKIFKAGIPCPKPLEFIKHNNRYGIIFPKLEGKTLTEEMSSNPWKVKKLAIKFAQFHRKLHGHEIAGLQKQNTYIETHLKACYVQLKPYWDRLQTLKKQVDFNQSVLCHGDLSGDNIIVCQDGWKIIDWATAQNGTPMADLVRSWIINQTPNPKIQKNYVRTYLFQHLAKYMANTYKKAYLHQNASNKNTFRLWVPLIAACRLFEEVPGEAERMHKYIQTYLD